MGGVASPDDAQAMTTPATSDPNPTFAVKTRELATLKPLVTAIHGGER